MGGSSLCLWLEQVEPVVWQVNVIQLDTGSLDKQVAVRSAGEEKGMNQGIL
jgi:hypothetical protein